MLVPQGMAYALLAGLPPEIGLYASTLPLLAYALLGTSRQLAVGPVAIVSLLTASALAPSTSRAPPVTSQQRRCSLSSSVRLTSCSDSDGSDSS